MNYDLKECGRRIRQLRVQHGYTQEGFARELNINRSYLSRVESGQKGSSVDLLIQISELFCVSLDYIVMGKVDSDNKNQLKAEILNLIAHLDVFQSSL